MKLSRLWKHGRAPRQVPEHPDIEAQTDKIVKGAMDDLGKALRRSALVRQHLADGALELKGGKQ